MRELGSERVQGARRVWAKERPYGTEGRVGRGNPRAAGGRHGPAIARMPTVRILEIDPGRWRVEFDSGLGLEVVLLFSRTVAFWRWGGELFAEVMIGEG